MLKSYAAVYKQGRLEWLDDAPEQDTVQVIVTLVDSRISPDVVDNSRQLMQLAGKISAFKALDEPVAWQQQQRDEWQREWVLLADESEG